MWSRGLLSGIKLRVLAKRFFNREVEKVEKEDQLTG
jgi:hypothetical protein